VRVEFDCTTTTTNHKDQIVNDEYGAVVEEVGVTAVALTTSPTISKLIAALAAAQGEIINPKKDVENTYFKSKYADLAAVWDAIRKPLSSRGIAIVQAPTFGTEQIKDRTVGVVTLTTMVAHESGEYMVNTYRAFAEGTGPQAAMSALTYAKRAALQALLGVAPEGEDDDGEQADGRGEKAAPALDPEVLEAWTKKIAEAKTLEDLKALWASVPAAEQKPLTKLVNAAKAKLVKASPPAQATV
jgi:hypothetical protein